MVASSCVPGRPYRPNVCGGRFRNMICPTHCQMVFSVPALRQYDAVFESRLVEFICKLTRILLKATAPLSTKLGTLLSSIVHANPRARSPKVATKSPTGSTHILMVCDHDVFWTVIDRVSLLQSPNRLYPECSARPSLLVEPNLKYLQSLVTVWKSLKQIVRWVHTAGSKFPPFAASRIPNELGDLPEVIIRYASHPSQTSPSPGNTTESVLVGCSSIYLYI